LADKEYYSFEEVLKDLKLEEDELKRLVSAGEIRAFRDKNTMRFKAEDVDRLRGDAGGDLELDDLELELEEDVKPVAPVARAPAVAPAPSLDDELTFEETTTEEIELQPTAPATAEAVEEAEIAAPARGRTARGGAVATRRAARVTTVEEAEEGREGVGVLAMLIVGALLLLCATFVVLDAVLGQMSNPLSKAVANLF
jgi:hypothetical protein